LAQTQRVALSAVNAAYLGAVQAELAHEVSAHSITQGQATTAYRLIARAVALGYYPLLGRS
jgi:hypothetical protein